MSVGQLQVGGVVGRQGKPLGEAQGRGPGVQTLDIRRTEGDMMHASSALRRNGRLRLDRDMQLRRWAARPIVKTCTVASGAHG